jgi:predicted XRE-type DNA-binding protein
MKRVRSKPIHASRGKLLTASGFSRERAIELKFKAGLYQPILKYAQEDSGKDLQAILGEPQPRIGELLNGKISNDSIDKLLYYAGRLGIEAKAKFSQTSKAVIEQGLAIFGTRAKQFWSAEFGFSVICKTRRN